MKRPISNTRGQNVGVYDDITGVYWTQRDAKKGEIFLRKHFFDGKYMEVPIAIDTAILTRLLSVGLKRIDIVIKGHRMYSYVVSFNPRDILSQGVKINYDKRNKDGQNYTGFGEQIVFDAKIGVENKPSQTKLTEKYK